jgi:hypothetical protein
MRGAVLALLLAGSVPALEAQEVTRLDRRATVLAGVGNSMGWFGAQGEKYFLGDRLSVFAGLGYTPDVDGNPSGITVAGGLRGFTPGIKHRGFLELSVSQVAVQYGLMRRLYGPGLQAGWQFATRGGFTLLTSAGVGYIPARNIDERFQLLIGLGVGYTWRR